MTKDGSPVLTDFEISKTVLSDMGTDDFTTTENPNALVGTREFWPPEVVDHYQYKYKRLDNGVYVRSLDGTNIDTLLTQDKRFYSIAYKARDCWALGMWMRVCFGLYILCCCKLVVVLVWLSDVCCDVEPVSVCVCVCVFVCVCDAQAVYLCICFTRTKTSNCRNTLREIWTVRTNRNRRPCIIRSRINVTRKNRRSCLPACLVCVCDVGVYCVYTQSNKSLLSCPYTRVHGTWFRFGSTEAFNGNGCIEYAVLQWIIQCEDISSECAQEEIWEESGSITGINSKGSVEESIEQIEEEMSNLIVSYQLWIQDSYSSSLVYQSTVP